MSDWNLFWIVPLAFLGTVGLLSGFWRFLNWLDRHHRDRADRWAERLFPGIGGKRQND
jgi:hypothetical protein